MNTDKQTLKKLGITQLMNKEKVDEAILAGRIMKAKPITTTYGTSLKLSGIFEARVNGKQYEAAIAYVPECVENYLQSMLLDENGEIPKTVKAADFVIKVLREPNDKVASKYNWNFESMLKSAERSSPLAGLLAEAGIETLALPAPSEKPKKKK